MQLWNHQLDEWFWRIWVHADEPTPAPASDICKFNEDTEVYHEVGTYGKDAKYFTIQKNSTSVAIKSLNNSFPILYQTLRLYMVRKKS